MVFLSHSQHDKALVEVVSAILVSQGASVYVDIKDPALPDQPGPDTAKLIKQKIEECGKFVVVATGNSLFDSKWVPWELGYADSKRCSNNVALFPVQKEPGEWHGCEYVYLYKTIRLVQGDWLVLSPDCNFVGATLNEWLRQ